MISDNTYRNNLTLLKNRWPELAQRLESIQPEEKVEVVFSSTGLPTFFYHNTSPKKILFHSQYNPQKEAYQFLENKDFSSCRWVFVLGLGFAYHIKQLLKNPFFSGELFIFEPSLEIFKSALMFCDLTEILAEPRVNLLVEPEIDKAKNFIFRAPWFRQSVHETKIVCLPVYRQVFNDYFCQILDILNLTLSSQLMGNVVTFQLNKKWEENCLANLSKFFKSVPLSSFFGKFKGYTGIIVSAGPSLDKNVSFLKHLKGKTVIISVGTALKSLLKAGIEPDFVVVLDADEIIVKQFEGISSFKDIWLFAEVCVLPKIISLFYPRVSFFCGVPNPILNYFYGKDKIIKEFIPSGGTVSNAALDIGRKLGLNPLVLVGQDLCLEPDGRSHATGSMHEGNYYKIDLENLNFLTVPGNYQEKVVTLRNFFVFLRWLEDYIRQHPEIEFINATAGGARISGTRLMTLEEVGNKYAKNESLDISSLYQDMFALIPKDYPAEILYKAKQAIRKLKAYDKQLAKYLLTSQELVDFLKGKKILSESQEKRFLKWKKKLLSSLSKLKHQELLTYATSADFLEIQIVLKNSRIQSNGYLEMLLRLPNIFSHLKESSQLVQRYFNNLLRS